MTPASLINVYKVTELLRTSLLESSKMFFKNSRVGKKICSVDDGRERGGCVDEIYSCWDWVNICKEVVRVKHMDLRMKQLT